MVCMNIYTSAYDITYALNQVRAHMLTSTRTVHYYYINYRKVVLAVMVINLAVQHNWFIATASSQTIKKFK